MKNLRRLKPLPMLLAIVCANYAAQIPYYLHQYYTPHRLPPNLLGSLSLVATLVWFLSAYRLLIRGSRAGWWLMFTYLLTVFLFYAQTQVMQFVIGHQILLYVYHPHDLLLFAVFGIGYVNCIAAGCYLVYLVIRRQELLAVRLD